MRRLDMVFLHPGQLHVEARPGCVSTVCGPGVVVCLWDAAHRWGGICHFLVSTQPARLRAKVFGGATAPGGTADLREIARQNIRFIHEQLAARRIPIQREDVGGDRGRKIVYYTESNRVKVLRAEQIRDRDWWAPLDALRRMRP